MKMSAVLALALLCITLTACGNNDNAAQSEAPKDHLFKAQQDTLEAAKDAARKARELEEQQRKAMENAQQ